MSYARHLVVLALVFASSCDDDDGVVPRENYVCSDPCPNGQVCRYWIGDPTKHLCMKSCSADIQCGSGEVCSCYGTFCSGGAHHTPLDVCVPARPK